MKKTIVSLAAIMFVLTMGLSFASAGDASTPPYNGITVFSTAPAANNAETVKAENKQLYNGITSFGTSPASASKAASSEAGAGSQAKQLHNGITSFSKS
jgi:hypothetical protein